MDKLEMFPYTILIYGSICVMRIMETKSTLAVRVFNYLRGPAFLHIDVTIIVAVIIL